MDREYRELYRRYQASGGSIELRRELRRKLVRMHGPADEANVCEICSTLTGENSCVACDTWLCDLCSRKCAVCDATVELASECTCYTSCSLPCATCRRIVCRYCLDECHTCKKTQCSDHLTACNMCEDNTCETCMTYCDTCEMGYDICKSCIESSVCEECEAKRCASCASDCPMCGHRYCEEHVEQCQDCLENEVCKDCLEDCGCCSRRVCKECLEKNTCKICDLEVCKECGTECATCSYFTCENHLTECAHCGGGPICEECLEDEDEHGEDVCV